jgi:hypothetical protein
MKKVLLFVMIVLVVFSQGCCSIFCSGSQNITVRSEPAGAKVQVGPYEGVAPYDVSIPRGKDYVVQATYDGQTKSQNLDKNIEPVYFVNILFWPGLIIDLATGKMWEYDPTIYNFNFAGSK